MARFPGAIWKPITASKPRRALTVHNRMNLHVAVSEAASQYGYFNQDWEYDGAGNVTRFIPDSHFYVRRDGIVEQYKDTELQAFADGEGNDATISVETQGMGGGTWTPEQRESLSELFAWAVKTHGIPAKLATNSFAGSSSSRGLSWHRLGIDGNFPALPSILAGREERGGGLHYSSSRGKECPGDDRIPQVPSILARSLQLLDPEPPPPPTPSFHVRYATRYTRVTTEPGGGTVVRAFTAGDKVYVRDGSGTEVDDVWYVATTSGNWVRSDHTSVNRPFHTREVIEETHVYEDPGANMTDRLLAVGTRFTVWDGSGVEVNDVWYVETTAGNWVRSAKTQTV